MAPTELLLLISALISSTTADAKIDRARVIIDSCPKAPLAAPELRRLLAMELSPIQLDATQTSTAVELVITIAVLDCGRAAKEAEISALSLRTGSGNAQRVRLDPRDASNARVLAVATAEMVLRLRAEKKPARPEPEPTPPPARELTTRTATTWRPTSSWEDALTRRALEAAFPPPKPTPKLSLHLGVETYPAVSSSLAALALEVTAFTSTSTPLRLELGAIGRAGVDRELRGRVTLAGAALNISLLTWTQIRTIELAAGPRLGAGWMTATGTPSSGEITGSQINGAIAELWLDLKISWEPAKSWSLGARASAGYIFSGLIAQADGSEVSGVDGAALAFFLSLARNL